MAAAVLLNHSVRYNIPAIEAVPAVAGRFHSSILRLCSCRVGVYKKGMRCVVVAGSPPHSGKTRRPAAPPAARADDSSASSEMSTESALNLLGVQEGASFEEIVRAKNSIVDSCKDDQEAIAKVEAAYDMLLLQSLNQRRSGKVANSNIRYADVKSIRNPEAGPLPQWLKSTIKNVPISFESPAASSLGVKAGLYGALMILTYANGASTDVAAPYSGPDVPGLILATGFGVSIYFLRKKTIGLGKATLMTAGGLVVGAVVGSAIENWLQVDVVPFLGIHSPAVIVSEFILLTQLLVSLYLR
ncbi:hypothetical protein HPP92_001456 [Vanilla planifolia]|uniref:Protein CHAPERONE-LIKE PROTEIN OF POR1, chloroplastic n=1 Tax=Vanilla planifolia TaxID=51239 RepID=A0A835RYK7_VANPL|nr:hypothetical protein HPP92_001746 [Vanilla planifolia]KAG0501384.1 hypothetical protein HPP92_001456 [Vanilla planifolia]